MRSDARITRIRPLDKHFLRSSGFFGPADDWNRSTQAAKPPCSGASVVFFGPAGRAFLSLSCSLGVDRGPAQNGGGHLGADVTHETRPDLDYLEFQVPRAGP